MDEKELSSELGRVGKLLYQAAEMAKQLRPESASAGKQQAGMIDKLTSAQIRVEVLLRKLAHARRR